VEIAVSLPAESGGFALVSAREDVAAFNKHGRDSLTPKHPDSLGKCLEIIGLATGVGARLLCRLRLPVDSSAD
jgi:hypothetical protein